MVSHSSWAHVPTQSLDDWSKTALVPLMSPWTNCYIGTCDVPLDQLRLQWVQVNQCNCKCPSRFKSAWPGLVYRGCFGLLGFGLLGLVWSTGALVLATGQQCVRDGPERRSRRYLPRYIQTDRHKQTDRQTDKQTHTGRQTKGQTDRQTNININRRMNTHAHMYTTQTGKQNKHKVMETILP